MCVLPCRVDVSKPTTTGRTGLTGFLEDKTGVTGAWTLGVGVAAYLLSKEIYVVNNEVGVAMQRRGGGGGHHVH